MDVRQRLLGGDLLAGAAAAILFLVLAFVVDVPFVLAIVLAVLAYIGIVLVRPAGGVQKDERAADDAAKNQLAFQTSLTKVATIRTLAGRIQKPEIRELVGRIADQSDQILSAMREDNTFVAAPLFLDQLLNPTEALLDNYVRLTRRGIKTADDILARNETQDLPMIEQAARTFFERMHRDDIVDLAALSEVLEFNLETMSPVMPRRSAP